MSRHKTLPYNITHFTDMCLWNKALKFVSIYVILKKRKMSMYQAYLCTANSVLVKNV